MLLTCHKFTGHLDGPHLLVTGGVHGDEFEPIAAIRRLIEMFTGPPSLSTELTGRVTFVPIVNEAAFLRGHRCAEDGLDLARKCPGRADGSVTEQTAHALSELIRQADFYIDLHTGGTELSVHPLAGYMLHEDPAVLAAQRRMARAFSSGVPPLSLSRVTRSTPISSGSTVKRRTSLPVHSATSVGPVVLSSSRPL